MVIFSYPKKYKVVRVRHLPTENLRNEIKERTLHEYSRFSTMLNTYRYNIVRTICC